LQEIRIRRTEMICTARIVNRTKPVCVLALLLIPAFSEARVISVQLNCPTIAFGGYSWPGIGQYEKINGVACRGRSRRSPKRCNSRCTARPDAARCWTARQDSRRQSRLLIKLL